MRRITRRRWFLTLLAIGVTASLARAVRAQQPPPNAPAPTAARLGLDLFGGENADARRIRDAHLAWMQVAGDNLLGATLTPVDETMRAQLGLHDGQGLVVSNVAGDGTAAAVGLRHADILLSLGDKSLGSPEDLSRQLKASGEQPVELKLLREGKPISIRVKPEYRVTLGPVPKEKRSYYIGVPIEAPDETLHVHLPALPAGQGLVATGVLPNSPAARAGVQPHDILLEFDNEPLKDTETLVARIQKSEGKEMPLKVLRAGKPLTLRVTPELRKEETDAQRDLILAESEELRLAARQLAASQKPYVVFLNKDPNTLVNWAQPNTAFVLTAPESSQPGGDAERIEKRLDDLGAGLKKLQQAIGELQKAVKKDGK